MHRSKYFSSASQKIPEVEGLRTLAIIMVLAFHFFARWTPPIFSQTTYPYRIEIARQVSQFGYLGVQLFFMVSGFVILKSLENQKNLRTFAIARVKRIFPSLLIAIPLIFVVCNALDQRFLAPIPFSSLLPSLTLLGPDFLNRIFSTNYIWTTGVLWSLFVEMQFYFVAGLLFFKFKKFQFNSKLFVFALSIQLIRVILALISTDSREIFDDLLPLNKEIWWFLAGSIYYSLLSQRKNPYLKFILSFTFLLNLLLVNVDRSGFEIKPITSLIVFIFYFLFYLIISKSRKIRILQSSIFVWLGGLSYEFYLIHESLGVSALSKFNQIQGLAYNLNLSILFLILVISGLLLISVLIKKLSKKFLYLNKGISASRD
jgi:peptidoglycan/LPS O-acetylase OafA/YrhL